MADVLVVADDLTGANATGAGFARAGLRSVTAGSGCSAAGLTRFGARFDVVVVSTDSRHSPPDEAARRVREAVEGAWPVQLVCKRVDTTLRGNVGAEALAARDAVAGASGRRVVVLCAPAHPGAGRVTVEGHQLLHGRRLEQTELARDVRSPVTTSEVTQVLAAQVRLQTALLPLTLVTGEPGLLVDAVREAVASGAEVLVADALNEEHLDRVAEAVVRAVQGQDLVLMTLDPGPGSLALARALGLVRDRSAAPLLAVSGSATDLTREQLARLRAEREVVLVAPVLDERGVPEVAATAARVVDALAAADGRTVLLATAVEESDVVALDDDAAARLPVVLGEVVRAVASASPVDGLYTTGGDVTAAVLEALDADGLEVEDEVVPLAVAGSLVGGPFDGLPVVTKGGLVGDADTAVACLDALAAAARTRTRRVPSAGRPGRAPAPTAP